MAAIARRSALPRAARHGPCGLLLLAAALGLLGAARLPAAQAAAPDDPAAVYQRYVAAINTGDGAAALALLSDDVFISGTVLCPEYQPCTGMEAARREVQFAITLHARATAGEQRTSGTLLHARLELRDDESRSYYLVSVVAHGGQIAAYVQQPDPDPPMDSYIAFVRRGSHAPSARPELAGGPRRQTDVAASLLALLGVALGGLIVAGAWLGKRTL
ncbi:MAG TPA: hypothetical protein VKV26_12635 [Dehalococcoidia bacterium]|nr:hypothetical protein [Dehalococcoidia bacterium]